MASKILEEYLKNEAKYAPPEIANKYDEMLREADRFILENKGMNEKANVLLIQIFMDELTEFLEKKEEEKHK